MDIAEAINTFKSNHLATLRSSTNTGYMLLFNKVQSRFENRAVESITANEIGQLLESLSAGLAKGTPLEIRPDKGVL